MPSKPVTRQSNPKAAAKTAHTLTDHYEDFFGWRWRCSCGIARTVHAPDPALVEKAHAEHVRIVNLPKHPRDEPLPGQTTIYDFIPDEDG